MVLCLARIGRDAVYICAPVIDRDWGEASMIVKSTFRWILITGVTSVAVACSAPMSTTGVDASTGSDASSITWQDGKQAYAISCDLPGGCQKRAQAMCGNGILTTLKSENMPTTGTARAALGKPSVVIRCG